ncbi:LysR family transcriptional regulator [Rhizobium sp. XQZ8]|uniref:LysR family transcriptional regulator n=1 Tax=Rhizobium populisoli TaxID=2859785 RepID=UPI001C687169|nr:LysR family transcriptional regulator [Rhizobium populisoli]MBW6421502.1 LysR family transcriptional regulator [Rhizobium populisoli]
MRDHLNDLTAFMVVARERSFTRAAAQLGLSQSRLSQTIRNLEDRLGVRLLTRTTRSVKPTEAGEHLLRTIGPRLEEIETELSALHTFGAKPSGTVRISTTESAAAAALWPTLQKVLPDYPDIRVEIIIDYGLTDIVASGIDAGVRPGEMVAQDMIAVPIGPDLRMAVVGSPEYFAVYKPPKAPQDLTAHCCINLRLPTYGGLYAWEFEKNGHDLRVRVDGQLVVGTAAASLTAALAGLGLAYLPEDAVREHLQSGKLVRVLDDWCEPFSGYHLYYPSRRHQSAAFSILIDALRYRR